MAGFDDPFGAVNNGVRFKEIGDAVLVGRAVWGTTPA